LESQKQSGGEGEDCQQIKGKDRRQCFLSTARELPQVPVKRMGPLSGRQPYLTQSKNFTRNYGKYYLEFTLTIPGCTELA
jgi:hypothetical protein